MDKIYHSGDQAERITEPIRLENVQRELAASRLIEFGLASSQPGIEPTINALKIVNQQLRGIEDDIRNCEQHGDFGICFVELARSSYR